MYMIMNTVIENYNNKSYLKESKMFEVSDKASEVIKEFLKGQQENGQSIRIYMSEGG